MVENSALCNGEYICFWYTDIYSDFDGFYNLYFVYRKKILQFLIPFKVNILTYIYYYTLERLLDLIQFPD